MFFFYRIALSVFILLCAMPAAPAEPAKLSITGKVLEEATWKPLEGVTVYIEERDGLNAISDRDGRFVLQVEGPGEYTVVAAAMGYEKSKPVTISGAPETLVLFLKPLYSLGQIIVEAERNQDKTGKTAVSGNELASTAGTAGNPVRALQALPGISSANGGGSVPAIRGSAPYNNAYYVDFMPVGYLEHSLGLSSVVNGALVEDVNVYTSSCGPEFGSTTGGIVDIRLRDPKKNRLGGTIDVSTAQASALLEGPITDSQSFYLGARRSYLDLIVSKEDFAGEEGITVRQVPQYYDYQAKYVWKPSDNHTAGIFTSGAVDSLKLTFTPDYNLVKHDPVFEGDYDFEKSYRTFGAILASRISGEVNNKVGISLLQSNETNRWSLLGHSVIDRDSLFIRDQMTAAVSENHAVLFGLEYDATAFNIDFDSANIVPSEWNPPPDYTSAERIAVDQTLNVDTVIIALKDRWNIAQPLTLVIGAQASWDDYLKKNLVEPKLSAEYNVREGTQITAGWGKYHNYPHVLMLVNGLGNPNLDYEKADQTDLGIEQKLPQGWSVKLEEYYKRLYDLAVPDDVENFINGGSGKAYGTELSFTKQDNQANWGGRFSVAYSRSLRHNDVTGESFPSVYDQPWIVNMSYFRQITPRWKFSARWRFQSGGTFTPVTRTYTDETGRIRPVYGELNSERLPSTHRLDLKITSEIWSGRQKVMAYIDIFNAYNQKNVYGYDYNEDYTSRKPGTGMSFFPLLGVETTF